MTKLKMKKIAAVLALSVGSFFGGALVSHYAPSLYYPFVGLCFVGGMAVGAYLHKEED